MGEKTKNSKFCNFFKDLTIQRIGVFALLVTNGYFLFKIYNQGSQIGSLNKTIENLSALNNSDLKSDAQAIFQSSFKDDLVLNSFSNSITIIIAFFTTLIALAAVFSFKKIDQEINYLKKSMDEVQDAKLIATEARIEAQNIANDLNAKILKESLKRRYQSLDLNQSNRINTLKETKPDFFRHSLELLLETIMYELEIINFTYNHNIYRDSTLFDDDSFHIILSNFFSAIDKEYKKVNTKLPYNGSLFPIARIKENIDKVPNSPRKITIVNFLDKIRSIVNIDI